MGIATAREALLAELMVDVDGLIGRVEALDASLAVTVEQAIKEASGKAFLAARMGFESMITEQERKLVAAGRNASAAISAQLGTGVTQLVAVNEALERKLWRLIALLAGLTVIGGAIGGVVAVKMLSL
ncbi:hypothetical protein QN379_13965 [Glaciimonas sp. Gout2]|uniref:hypothetical protein n=1 Tax=unclassified Glaciimonas TaxID=2644401 RepID=UPI002B2254B8|nr:MULTISPECIES: hypothetical protein [unclassified Glaciimonas]MEB0013920.1 hypothetical protein [Glaciimonas sp. Cout2]MEB0083117.1 hypothetical protein [Glaciimonas sp. Gout2]